MPNAHKRKLAAILFADIVGYTTLMQKDEMVARQLLDKFHFEISTKVSDSKGQVINNYGDGCLCTFDSAVDAMQCAKELQQEFQSLPKVPVRIGLHSGDVFFEKDNVYGDSVNIASRIESIGLPGAVLFSERIKRHIDNQPEFKTKFIGSFDFKNVEESIEIFALANKGLIVPKKEKLKGKINSNKKNKREFSKNTKRIVGLLAIIILAYFIFNKKRNDEILKTEKEKYNYFYKEFPKSKKTTDRPFKS